MNSRFLVGLSPILPKGARVKMSVDRAGERERTVYLHRTSQILKGCKDKNAIQQLS